jgi:hypothetical protein
MSCKDTPILIKTKYSIKDYLYWNFLILIPSLLGSIAIARQSSKLAAAYIILAFLSFSIIQLYFPFNLGLSYSKPKNNLKPVMPCRVSKISKNGKGRRSYFVKIILILVGLILFSFPIQWLVKDLLLLVAYALAWMLLLLTLRRYGFVKCINPEYSAKVFEGTTKQCEREEFSQENNFFSKYSEFQENRFLVQSLEGYTFLKTKHEFRDFLYWNFITLTLLSSAGLAIGIYSTQWLFAYIFLAFFHFYILEQRFFCTHCPYYAVEGNKVKCMMNWGWPKYFKPRLTPPGKFELSITSFGFIILILFPFYWLLKEPFLLGAYLISMLIFLLTIWRYECPHCIYFSCPFNRVPIEVRKKFEEKEKTIWNCEIKNRDVK